MESDISIKFTKIVEYYKLTNHTPSVDTDKIKDYHTGSKTDKHYSCETLDI